MPAPLPHWLPYPAADHPSGAAYWHRHQQLTNWENSHLTEEQAHYASTDAWATLTIYLELQKTKPLSKKEVEALKQSEREAQILRQQQALALKALKEQP